MRVTFSILYRCIGCAVFLGIVSAGCSKGDKVQARAVGAAAKTIKSEPVKTQAIRRNVEVVGTLAADDQVTISAEASGTVSRILADLGDRVIAGQVLIELDREKLRYNADEQNAGLERALAKYGAATPDHLPSIEQTPDVQKAAAELLQAKQSLDRAAELYKRQLVPKQILDDADATYRAKQATYESALQNAKNLRADIAASVASAKMADRQLRDASSRAPFGGYVERRLVSLGQLVNVQTPVMSVVRVDPLKVTAEIPEALAPWVKVAQPVTLFVDAYPDKPFTATVSRISPSVSPQSRAFAFEALVPNPGNDAEARHVRARAPRKQPRGSGADPPFCCAPVPLRSQSRVRRPARATVGPGAEGGRARGRARRDPRWRSGRRCSRAHRRGPTGRRTARDRGPGQRIASTETFSMLAELCVRRPVFATMLVMSLVVLGIFSFRTLGVDLFPKADPATVNVALSLPGASPDEMASSVVEPVEEALSSVSGIDELTSGRITEGSANVTVKFVLERDINDAANDVREKVASAMGRVPPELLPPVITKVDPDSDPVMTVVVSSDAMSLRTLTEIADKQVKRALATVNGVGQVALGGGRAREVHIVVDIEKLNSYGLSIQQVRDAVVGENVEIPGGTVEQGKSELLLRTLGRIDATEQFNNIVIATNNGTPIRVSDIGYAEDGVERPKSAAWLNGTPAVTLDIVRATGENTVSVIEGVKQKLASVRKALPPSVNMTITRDDSTFIYASVEALEEHLVWGSLFAAIVVMFFIRNVRAVVIAALAIPASIIAAFTLMRAHGLHAEQHDAARHHACRRHRHRRRDRRPREYLSLYRGEAVHAVRSCDSGHPRSGARGDGDHPVACRDLPANRLHDRICAPVHQPVRLDDGVFDPGVDAGQLHADPDAQLAVSEGGRRRPRSQDQGVPFLPVARSAGTRDG